MMFVAEVYAMADLSELCVSYLNVLQAASGLHQDDLG